MSADESPVLVNEWQNGEPYKGTGRPCTRCGGGGCFRCLSTGEEPATREPPDEQTVALARMKAAGRLFYGMARLTGVHTFIELNGLISEYIKIFEEAHARGVPFDDALARHHAAYIGEKLSCIYGDALLRHRPLREAFVAELFGGRHRLIEDETQPATATCWTGAEVWCELCGGAVDPVRHLSPEDLARLAELQSDAKQYQVFRCRKCAQLVAAELPKL